MYLYVISLFFLFVNFDIGIVNIFILFYRKESGSLKRCSVWFKVYSYVIKWSWDLNFSLCG